MLMPKHDIISARPSGMTTRRMATIGGVGLLHAVAITAIIVGMKPEILPFVPPDIIMIHTPEQQTPPKTVPVPVKPTLVQPTQPTTPTVPIPVIDIATTTTPTITVVPSTPNTPPSPDTLATSVGSTHSTPPYPVAERDAGHQGTVLLTITVSPQGDAVNASVTQSSGFPALDESAVAWVMAHWKYKPAIRGGVPVTSQTQAAVKFDLKLAHR